MIIRLTRNAVNTLDRVYTDRSIYDNHGHFTEWFLKWNYIFHQYVRESVLSTISRQYGMFSIGAIGSLAYVKYNILGVEVLVIRNFYFPTFKFTSSSIPTVDAKITGEFGRADPDKRNAAGFRVLSRCLSPRSSTGAVYLFGGRLRGAILEQDHFSLFGGHRTRETARDGKVGSGVR